MATRTVSNTGGNWNATTAWVGGVVPVAGDDVNFTATSGNLVVNVSTANLVGITFANYVGTITFDNQINTSGFVNLGTGGYTQAGASGLNLVGTTSLTSNAVIWSRTLRFSGTNITYTLVDTWTVTGDVTFAGTTTLVINGNTLNIGASLSITSAAITSGTTLLNLNGTGTWSHSTTGIIRNNLTINTIGTITISGNVYYNTGTITYTAGTVITTGSTLNIASNTTLATNGMVWNGITTTGTLTLTLANNLSLSGTYLLSSSTTVTFNGFTVFMGGNLTLSGTSMLGTSLIVLSGNGTWSGAGVLSNNLTIDSATGSRTISGSVFYQTGTMSYVAGTVSTTGSTLTLSGTSSMATNGIVWDNITLTGTRVNLGNNLTLTGSMTIASATVSFALNGNNLITSSASLIINNGTIFNVPQNMTFSNLITGNIVNTTIINSNQIAVLGNLTISGANNPAPNILGTTTIVLAGTGTWSSPSGNVIYSFNTIINTPGTIFISGNVYFATRTLSYVSGTVVTTGSTLNIFGSGSPTISTHGIVWDNVITPNNSYLLTGTFTLNVGNTLSAAGTVNIGSYVGASNVIITVSGAPVITSGNFTVGPACTIQGTSNFIMTGNGTWSTSGLLKSNLIFNSSGTINASGTLNFNGATLSYVSGNVVTTGSTLVIGGNTTLSTGTVSWNAISVSAVLTLGSDLNVAGSLSVPNSGGLSFVLNGNNLNTTAAAISLGTLASFTVPQNLTCTDLSVNGGCALNGNQISMTRSLFALNPSQVASVSGTTTLIFTGTGTWSHPSTTTTTFVRNPVVFNTSGTIYLSTFVLFNGTLTYTAGTIVTTGSNLILGNNNISPYTSNLTTNGITWNNISVSAISGQDNVINLINPLTTTGTLTLNRCRIAGSQSNINGSLVVNDIVSGSSSLVIGGSGTWSGGGRITNNLTINTPGTLNISGGVSYDTGTFSYIAGTVNTAGSTLNIATTTTLNTSTINWFNLTTGVGAMTFTLRSNFTVTNLVTIPTGFTNVTFVLNGFNFIANGSEISFGINSTLTVPGTFSCADITSGGNGVINGGPLLLTRNMTMTNSGNNGGFAGSSTIIFTGTGTWSASPFGGCMVTNNIVFNTSGTIFLSPVVRYTGGTITYTSGTINTTGSTLQLGLNNFGSQLATLSTNGITWNNISIPNMTSPDTKFTLTLTNPLTVNGTLTMFNALINGAQLNLNGSLTSNGLVQGTSSVLFGGTGTWSGSGRLTNNTNINTSGTLIISGVVSYDTGILNYITGTVITTGSTLTIVASSTLRTDGIVWNNITTSNTIVITLQNNLSLIGTLLLSTSGLSFTLAGNNLITSSASLSSTGTSTLTVPQILTFRNFSNSSGTTTLNGNSINLNGNITLTGGSSTQGTSNINVIGTGTWSQTGSSAIRNNLSFNTPGNTFIVSGTVNYLGGTLSYVAGNIVTNNSTLSIASLTTGLNTPGLTWGAVSLATTTNLGADLIVGSTFSLNTAVVNGVGRSVFARGDFSVSNSNSGTALIVLNGTGTWSMAGATRVITNNLTINTAGVITVSGVVNYSTGTITYTAGTVIVTGSTLTFDNSSTINTSGMSWNNITFATSNQTATLLSQLVAIGTMSVGNLTLNFAGNGFNVANLTQTAARILTLAAGQTNSITNNFVSTVGSEATKSTIQSSSVGTQSRLILSSNATQDLSFVNATDINSDGGQTIYSYRGTFSRTNNWRILPTDVSGGESTGIFFG